MVSILMAGPNFLRALSLGRYAIFWLSLSLFPHRFLRMSFDFLHSHWVAMRVLVPTAVCACWWTTWWELSLIFWWETLPVENCEIEGIKFRFAIYGVLNGVIFVALD